MRAINVDRGQARRAPQLSAGSLILANIGLLSFAVSMVFYLENTQWDLFALFCVVGYVFCAAAFCVPPPGGAVKLMEPTVQTQHDSRAWWRVFASLLNAIGLVLGVIGSAMYSPTFVSWVRGEGVLSGEEFEILTDYSNVIWAVSFVCFPLASALTLRDKVLTLRKVSERTVSVFDPAVFVHTWILVSLCIFAVGGVMFCLDEHESVVRAALVLFGVGGFIKLILMMNELFLFCTCADTIAGDDDSPTETSPLLSDNASETSSLLGDV
jgi:hypothetical protein